MKSRRGDIGGGMKPTHRMDKKASRGMDYESETMRMRSMDINAEIDRGHSDLRKLKKENETLKQQVWTLRDEYDKLETIVKEMEEDGNEDDDDDDDEDEEEEEDEVIEDEISNRNIPKTGEENVVTCDNGNVDNLQKIYRKQLQSVEYMLQQGTEINSNVLHIQPHSCSSTSSNQAMCSSVLQMHQQPVDPPLIITPSSSEISSHHATESSLSHPDSYITASDHFNLDQLLDFASSFHYDRRKHLTDDDTTLTVTIPKEKETCSIAEENENICNIDGEITSPSSSTGFSTIRRRSSTVIEKLKSKNSSSILKEVKQVSLCNDGVNSSGSTFSETPEVSNDTTTVSYTRSSYYFAGSLDGRSQSLGGGLNAAATAINPGSSECPLYSSSSANNIASAMASSSLDSNLPLVSVYSKRTPSMVRLSNIEPNTVMVSVSEMPQLWDICTQEIIDELERQVSSTMPDIRGVRVTSRAAYICLGHRESLEQLMECGLTVRGTLVPLIDITHESIIVALTGVPHYIADATLSILLSAFGIIIGEIERRFYKGVDTGERFVRLKLKKHVKLPKYVTVGGCRIVLDIHGGAERQTPQIQDWNPLSNSIPPPTPHTIPRETLPDFPPPLSAEVGLNSTDVGEAVRIGTGEVHYHKAAPDRRDSITSGPKTFASRCIVNLKLPDRPCSSSSGPKIITHREAPLPPESSTTSSSINAGHVLRAGSLCKGSRRANEDQPPQSLTVPQITIKSPIINRRIRLPSLSSKDQTRSRPASVVAFEDSPNVRQPPPLPQVPLHTFCPTPLANGILRKPTLITNSEQEALLPGQQTQKPTATIRNRLKLGRSANYDAGKQKQQGEKAKTKKKKKKTVRMRKNTNEDSNDQTPLGASGSRRDSDKSSQSSKEKNKQKKEVIDLPWCGCWGNGCF